MERRALELMAAAILLGACTLGHARVEANGPPVPVIAHVAFRSPFGALPNGYSQALSTVALSEATVTGHSPFPFSVHAPSSRYPALTIEWTMTLAPKSSPFHSIVSGPGLSISVSGNYGSSNAIFCKFDERLDGIWLGTRSLSFETGPLDGVEHHYAVTYDPKGEGATDFYLDGERVGHQWWNASGDEIGPRVDSLSPAPAQIFELGDTKPNWSGITIADLRISTVALTAFEVKANFEAQRSYDATYYAAPNGSPHNAGSASSPLDLGSALAKAGPRVRIALLGGTYAAADFVLERGGSSPLDDCLVEPSSPSVTAVVDASSASARVSGALYATVRNLDFKGDGETALAVSSVKGRLLLDACTFASTRDGIHVTGSPGVIGLVTPARLENHFPAVVVQNGVVSVLGTGIDIESSPGCVVRNNTIVGVPGEVGVKLGSSNVASFLNNIISGPSVCLEVTGIASVVSRHAPSVPRSGGKVAVFLSIPIFAAGGNDYHPASGGSIARLIGTLDTDKGVSTPESFDERFGIADLNALQRFWYALAYPDEWRTQSKSAYHGLGGAPEGKSLGLMAESTSLVVAPAFVSPAKGEYALAATHGNVQDAGIEHNSIGTAAPLYDARGTPRPQGTAIDMGAFESEGADQAQVAVSAAIGGKTSAGVYDADGALVKTLWSGRRLDPQQASVTATWNGLDEYGAVTTGTHSVRVVQNDLGFTWQGVIGNNSEDRTGPNVMTGFNPMISLAIAGTQAFWSDGYDEGRSELHRFDTSNIRRRTGELGVWGWDIYTTAQHVATDGTLVYASYEDGTSKGPFVVAYNVSDDQPASSFGVPSPFPKEGWKGAVVIGAVKESLHLAVQTNGPYLFVSAPSYNQVFVLDKVTGKREGSFSFGAPTAIATTPSGDLWVACTKNGAHVVELFDVTAKKVKETITGFSLPVAIAVDPKRSFLVVADAADSQQLKFFSASGKSLGVYGQKGGYAVNGPLVTNDKFEFGYYYSSNTYNVEAALALGEDGKLFVGDTATDRVLVFETPDTLPGALVDHLQMTPLTYPASIDLNDPHRALNKFCELEVDLTKPLVEGAGWKLVRFWGSGQPLVRNGLPLTTRHQEGFQKVATLSNGRTYGIVTDTASGRHVVELTPQGLRITSATVHSGTTLLPDGSLAANGQYLGFEKRVAADQTVGFYRVPLDHFDANNDPVWAAPVLLSEAPNRWVGFYIDPVDSGSGFETTVPADGLVFSYCPNNYPGCGGAHLGAMKEGGTSWLWRAAFTTGPFDGHGNFDTNSGFCGNRLMVAGKHVVFGYHGEFWAAGGSGEANQFVDYTEDGLFLGQFGMPNQAGGEPAATATLGLGQMLPKIPGAAGNSFYPSLVEVGSEVYLLHNDESHSGLNVWRIHGTMTEATQALRGP